MCYDGYNDPDCSGIDECFFNNHNCTQLCIDFMDGVECFCYSGFTLLSDGVTCDCTSGFNLSSDGVDCTGIGIIIIYCIVVLLCNTLFRYR